MGKINIFKNGQLFARYWHDFRGDEHCIEFVDGTNEYDPVGRGSDFIKGGGSEPLVLSEKAIAFLEQREASE